MDTKKVVIAGAGLAAILLAGALVMPRPGPAPQGADEVPDTFRANPASGSPSPEKVPGTFRAASAAAAAAATPPSPSPGARPPGVVAELGWGSGPNQLGRDRPEEGNPEGPMSLTFDGKGRTLVLDQVNGRIVRLDSEGKPVDTMPVPVQAAQDLVTTPDGKTLVLDRLADRAVAIMDEGGRVVGELPLEGAGIDEAGGVTGVFVDGEDVYVEREHGALVRVGNTSGQPDTERPELPGRPTRDGKHFINAGLIEAPVGRFYVTALSRPEQDHLYTREFQLGAPLLGILALDSDLQGTIYVAVLVEQLGGSAADTSFEIRLLCLNAADGAPIGQNVLPATALPEESFRDFAALDTGGMVYAYRSESGVQYQRVDCR